MCCLLIISHVIIVLSLLLSPPHQSIYLLCSRVCLYIVLYLGSLVFICRIFSLAQVYLYVCIHIVGTRLYPCAHDICIYIYTHTYIYIYMYMYICKIYTYIYIYIIHIHTYMSCLHVRSLLLLLLFSYESVVLIMIGMVWYGMT